MKTNSNLKHEFTRVAHSMGYSKTQLRKLWKIKEGHINAIVRNPCPRHWAALYSLPTRTPKHVPTYMPKEIKEDSVFDSFRTEADEGKYSSAAAMRYIEHHKPEAEQNSLNLNKPQHEKEQLVELLELLKMRYAGTSKELDGELATEIYDKYKEIEQVIDAYEQEVN